MTGSVTSIPDTHRWQLSRQSPRFGWVADAREDLGELLDRPADGSTGSAEFEQEPRALEVRASARSSAGSARSRPVSSPAPRCEPTANDDIRVDRAGHVERRRERGLGLPVQLVVRRGEVDQIERVAEHVAQAGRLASLAKRARFSSVWFVGRHIRGLCVKICAAPPIASMRSTAVKIPPELETWAPKSTRLP